jgi:hypothetical protein
MLKARAGTDSTMALVRKGARIDCTLTAAVVEGNTVTQCLNGTIYPPSDY